MTVRRDDLPPPSRLLFAAELPRALVTMLEAKALRPRLAGAPRGDGRPVLLLPGVVTGDGSVAGLARFLRRLGYAAESWGLGLNLGTRTIGAEGERLLDRVAALHAARQGPVTLIGVSLGGIMARLAAHRLPGAVGGVITINAPYAASGRATNVWRVYERVSGEKIDSPAVAARLTELRKPLPVPAAALWSRSDGLVNGAACFVPGEPGLRVIEVPGGHLMVHQRVAVWRVVADLLATMPAGTADAIG